MKKFRSSIKGALYLILGNFGYSVAFNCFFTENNIAAGGFGGLGLVINSVLPVSTGVAVFVISVPVFIWSYVIQGTKYTLSALISTLAFSVFLDVFSFLPNLTDDRLLAAICGGALYGVSASLLTMGRVAGSGTDLLSRLLVTRLRRVSLGGILMFCDGIVVALSVIAFGDIESGILAVVAVFVMTTVMDTAVRGVNRACLFEIIPDGPVEELAKEIMELGRGVTLVQAQGMYQRTERDMLLVVVRPREVYAVKDLIREKCPGAFVMLLPANEIMGRGFEGIDLTVPMRENDGDEQRPV